MKKYLFFIVIIILLLGNFVLRYIHTNNIQTSLNEISKVLANNHITLDLSTTKFEGIFFWKIKTTITNAELYSTFVNNMIYFVLPEIDIISNFSLKDDIIVYFPKAFKGFIKLNDQIKEQLHLMKEYKIFLYTTNNPIMVINSQNFHITLKEFMVKLNDESSDNVSFISSIEISRKNYENNDAKSQFLLNLNNINFFSNQLKQYHPDINNIIINEKNNRDINLENIHLNFLLNTNNINTNNTLYDGEFTLNTKSFVLQIIGENTYRADQNVKNISHFDCTIKHFSAFIDSLKYITTLIQNQNATNIIDIFARNVLKYSKEKDDIVKFTFEDDEINQQTLFEKIPLKEVFAEIINVL